MIRALDVNCEVIFSLLGRWWDGDLPEEDRDAFEQHLLFCPPCLDQCDKLRTVIDALRRESRVTPDPRTVERVTRQISTAL